MKSLIEGLIGGVLACGLCALFGWPIWVGFLAAIFIASCNQESELDKAMREAYD